MLILLQVLYSSHQEIYLKQLCFMISKHMVPPTDGAAIHNDISSIWVWKKIYIFMYMPIKLLPQW